MIRGLLPLLLVTLTACSGGSGSGTESNLNTGSGSGGGGNYQGPAPQTDDVQSFKINVWDNLSPENRCGSCHNTGPAPTLFVRDDNINLAYNEANGIVDLNNPANSRMVTRVASGHNCWLASDQACADIITGYISDWASETVGAAANVVVLTAPQLKDVGDSKSFPADSNLFSGVHNLLTTYCANCHSDEAATPQQPYFASPNIDTAYDAVKSKIDLDTPANSRLVVRLRNEFHNCWDDCAANAQEMEDAITAYADAIPLTTVDPDWVISKALTLFDGVVASSGGRHEANVIALYEFKAGQGSTAFDTSGIDPAIDLTLNGNVEWIGGWGIRINDGKAQGSTSASSKLYNLITATGEYSIETWVAPANVTQEDAYMVSYSGGTALRNFTMGQTLYNYDFFNRSSVTDANGEAAHSTPDAEEVLQATLQHVVMTYEPVNGRRIYVNGEERAGVDLDGGGTLAGWDNSFALVLGNEVSSNRLWQGAIRLVAIHNRVLTQEQIQQNFAVGVGEKFFLLFNVTDLINVPDSYIVFEVSQFDSYSYLFNAPFFISLDGDAAPDNIPLRGIRLGINGKQAVVGQVYTHLDTTLNSSDYQAGSGQVLSDRGTIIALEKGSDADEFFLTFEQLGDHANVVLPPVAPTPAAPADLPPQAEIGLRNFAEINATMAAITGVSPVYPDVKSTYDTVRQQLPSVENIGGFLSSQQMGVTQLAIEYCNALVEDSVLRDNFFPAVNFADSPATAFDSNDKRNAVIDPLLEKIFGTNLSVQPDESDAKIELNNLMDTVLACGNSCPAGHTQTVVKATCAAVLGSAAMLVQ